MSSIGPIETRMMKNAWFMPSRVSSGSENTDFRHLSEKEKPGQGHPGGGEACVAGPLSLAAPIYGVAGLGAGGATTADVPLPAGASGMISWI